jgi:hypothetical protein
MACWSQTRRLTKRTRPRGTIAQDPHRRAGRRAQTLQPPSLLLTLPIGLGRHAAAYDLAAVVIAHLGKEDLERAHLIAAH